MMEKAGLYIHIPFCRSKCPYCAFVSSPCKKEPPLSYLKAVNKQLAAMSENSWCQEQTFSTIFIGGGTPTIYSGEHLSELIKKCLSSFEFTSNPEISIETNPNSVSTAKLAALREAGVNRLSIGIQSFSDRILSTIGRSHSVKEADLAIKKARATGFDNLNLDFIYGLPSQSLDSWQETLEQALSYHPEHLALYEMTIEPETPFALMEEKGILMLPDQDEMAAMEEFATQQLAAGGLQRYEISNFAKPGFECRHNINYWQNGSYLGLGAAAFSCFDGFRVNNVTDHLIYEQLIKQEVPPFQEGEALSEEASFRESIITGLRMIEGISISMLKKRYGLDPLTYYGKTIEKFLAGDMLKLENDQIRLTKKSLPIANQVLSELV